MRKVNTVRRTWNTLSGARGSQIAEFAVTVPLLALFAVGVIDFSGAFTIQQKMNSAAQEGALVASSQPTFDLVIGQTVPLPPPSIQAIEKAVFLDLEDQNVLPGAIFNTLGCGTSPNVAASSTGPSWTYTITGCPGTLTITIDRACVVPVGSSPGNCSPVSSTSEKLIFSHVQITYPYSLQFNGVFQLIGGSSAGQIVVTSDAYSANES